MFSLTRCGLTKDGTKQNYWRGLPREETTWEATGTPQRECGGGDLWNFRNSGDDRKQEEKAVLTVGEVPSFVSWGGGPLGTQKGTLLRVNSRSHQAPRVKCQCVTLPIKKTFLTLLPLSLALMVRNKIEQTRKRGINKKPETRILGKKVHNLGKGEKGRLPVLSVSPWNSG